MRTARYCCVSQRESSQVMSTGYGSVSNRERQSCTAKDSQRSTGCGMIRLSISMGRGATSLPRSRGFPGSTSRSFGGDLTGLKGFSVAPQRAYVRCKSGVKLRDTYATRCLMEPSGGCVTAARIRRRSTLEAPLQRSLLRAVHRVLAESCCYLRSSATVRLCEHAGSRLPISRICFSGGCAQSRTLASAHLLMKLQRHYVRRLDARKSLSMDQPE